MKRLNPETGMPFKKGHLDKNGRVFWNYKISQSVKKDGYFAENWCSNLSQFKKQKEISLKLLSKNKKYSKNPYSPSLDKIDSKIKEYSESNTRVVLSCVNDALNQYGLEHFLKVAKAVIDKQKGD